MKESIDYLLLILYTIVYYVLLIINVNLRVIINFLGKELLFNSVIHLPEELVSGKRFIFVFSGLTSSSL